MDKLYVPLLILMTSAFGYLYAQRRWGVGTASLQQALRSTLELVGCWILVYAANLLFGLALILLLRRLTGFFVSVYVLGGLMPLLFTVLQALVFYHLWQSGRKG
jgi:heme/copper-type cytochrome/quinol oxidase subunit 3